ncbi:hypothetical protein E4U34_003847 [Claviceps purpurea]|nr:hypothetical protein E4U34_003847 [Claviceps purpurea]
MSAGQDQILVNYCDWITVTGPDGIKRAVRNPDCGQSACKYSKNYVPPQPPQRYGQICISR